MDKLTKKIDELCPENWRKTLHIPGVYLFKNTQTERATPTMYQASMVFITSWSKKIQQEDRVYSYGKWKFLLVSIPTPFVCEASADENGMFAWICISINKNDLFELIKQFKWAEKPTHKKHNLESGVLSLDINDKIYQALEHLLDCWSDPFEAQILWPSIIKAIMFYAIKESDAQSFCDLVLTNKNLWNFWDMIEDINLNYKNDISIENLAEEMDMSIPTFYRQFKSLTGFSPNQYIKNLRLSKAKELLMWANYSVKQAAREVWYNSQFQFSREYKRYYWYAPIMEGW